MKLFDSRVHFRFYFSSTGGGVGASALHSGLRAPFSQQKRLLAPLVQQKALFAPFSQQNAPAPPLKQQSGKDSSGAPLAHLVGGGVGSVGP